MLIEIDGHPINPQMLVWLEPCGVNETATRVWLADGKSFDVNDTVPEVLRLEINQAIKDATREMQLFLQGGR